MFAKQCMVVFVIACTSRALAWMHLLPKSSLSARSAKGITSLIDYQADPERFGRGEMHLSALLEERDVVVFQSGSWYVDGVLVGDGPIQYEYCMVESLQVVWTHNCEHGVIRGYSLRPMDGDNDLFQVDPTWNSIEFGPEQLLARLPVDWLTETTCKLLVPWNEEVFQPKKV